MGVDLIQPRIPVTTLLQDHPPASSLVQSCVLLVSYPCSYPRLYPRSCCELWRRVAKR